MKNLAQHITESFKIIPFDSITIDDAIKGYPVSDNAIIKIAKDLTKKFKKNVIVSDSIINSSNSKKYGTFIMIQRTLLINFPEIVQSDVTPGGEYHEQKGKRLHFHFRSNQRNDGLAPTYEMNCSFDNPGGMSIYKGIPVSSANDIKKYMQSIIDDATSKKYN